MSIASPPSAVQAVLKQGYRNNWQQYLAALNGEHGTLRGWDLVVLTASNETQAEAYRAQIEARQLAGQLPTQTEYLIIADPAGRRIGSGGATLNVLRELDARFAPGDALSQQRVLVIHSGGDSKRLPHCSAIGKLFTRLPHELPDGRPSSLFDEFIVSLSGLPARVPCGLLVTSGDTLILFDHLQLNFERPGVVGVGALAAAETGTHHGVYVPDGRGYAVARFLHKPDRAQLQRQGALLPGDQVLIDTGLVWFDWPTCQRLLALEPELRATLADGLALNLYGDLLAPLAADADFEAYLADESDGPATPALRAARRRCWQRLRGTLFGVEQLQPARFIHFGATRELLAELRQGLADFSDCGWTPAAASWLPRPQELSPTTQLMAAGAYLADAVIASAGPGAVCLCDSLIEAQLQPQGSALLANVWTRRASLPLPDGVVVHQLPLQGGGYVTRIYGLDDNPKDDLARGAFCGLPWRAWLSAAGVSADDLWPAATAPAERTLWDAQLYPVAADREASLEAVLWLPAPAEVDPQAVAAWRSLPRLSLAQSFAAADVARIIQDDNAIQNRVRVQRFLAGVQQERPAEELAAHLASRTADIRRYRLAADSLEEALDPWLPMRGYRALEVASQDSRWGDRAFSALARLVRAHTPHNGHVESALAQAQAAPTVADVRAAARLDFGGGWTDTPPYCLERGGTVLNAAIALQGELPIMARAERTAAPQIVLENRDIDAAIRPLYAGDLLNFANPGDPFALHKAALVFRGVIPADTPADTPIQSLCRRYGSGLTLTTGASIPRGSGLGTSSILAGAILKALAQALGRATSDDLLYDEVLCVEQMITTGGGWQDQIGGLLPGIKLLTSTPGLPQRVTVQPVPLSDALRGAFDERLMLIYTGQRRLAKDLLRRIMGRWMAREPEMVHCLGEIARLARQMRDALLAESLDSFGPLLTEHWAVLKRMDPGCTNPFIDDLWATLDPFIAGGKLAGAGGGGFALVILRDAATQEALASALAARYNGQAVRSWPCAIAVSQSLEELRS